LKYKNLNLAFLIEILVGFGTILSISLLGYKGLTALVLIALRPFLLEREQIKNDKLYWQFTYKILSGSLMIIFLMIISIFIILQFIPVWRSKLPTTEILLIVIIPFFLLTHGVIGFINSSEINQSE
jgi:hypothetical protein